MVKFKKISKIIIFSLKLFLSIILLYFFISKFGGLKIINNIKLINPLSFISAVGISLFTYYFASIRWKILIFHRMATNRLFSIYMIGSFFSNYLPGIIGGDAVKAYYLSRELKNRNEQNLIDSTKYKGIITQMKSDKESTLLNDYSSPVIAIASIFIDRYMGLFALLCIGLLALPLGYQYIHMTPLRWFLPIMFIFLLSTSFFIFKYRVGKRFTFIANVYEYFRLYGANKNILIKVFFYSVIIQILAIFSLYILSIGMDLPIPLLSLLVFMPIVTFITLIPVSIAGLGIREGLFVLLLRAVGVSSDMAITLSIVWFISIVTANLWGLIEYLRYHPI